MPFDWRILLLLTTLYTEELKSVTNNKPVFVSGDTRYEQANNKEIK